MADAKVDIDLDALRRVREERYGKKRSVRFGGKRFELPNELPIEFAMALVKGDPETALRVVLGDAYDGFMEGRPTYGDFADFSNAIAALYTGENAPNSAASGSS